jgi:isocitrate dehydrogenase
MLRHLGWETAADLVIKGMDGAIGGGGGGGGGGGAGGAGAGGGGAGAGGGGEGGGDKTATTHFLPPTFCFESHTRVLVAAAAVTYDFHRLMPGAKLLKCSEFGKAVVSHM